VNSAMGQIPCSTERISCFEYFEIMMLVRPAKWRYEFWWYDFFVRCEILML